MSKALYPLRVCYWWDEPELAIVVSLQGIVPDCFMPNPSVVYEPRGLHEDSAIHRVFRDCVAKHRLIAEAVIAHGIPSTMSFVNNKVAPRPSPVEVARPEIKH